MRIFASNSHSMKHHYCHAYFDKYWHISRSKRKFEQSSSSKNEIPYLQSNEFSIHNSLGTLVDRCVQIFVVGVYAINALRNWCCCCMSHALQHWILTQAATLTRQTTQLKKCNQPTQKCDASAHRTQRRLAGQQNLGSDITINTFFKALQTSWNAYKNMYLSEKVQVKWVK